MEKLHETYTKHGLNYKLLKRNDKAAIYEVYNKEQLHIGYEVFIVKVYPEFKWPNGTIKPEGEGFPSSEMFGKTAWTYMAKELALTEKRYDEITNGILKPVHEEVDTDIEVDINLPKKSRGRPAKNPGVPKVSVVRTPRAKFVYEGKEYNSKSDVARILLAAGEGKESIAKKLKITVQTIHAVSIKMKAEK